MGIGAAECAEVELLGPALPAVEAAEKNDEVPGEAALLLRGNGFPRAGFVENGAGFTVRIKFSRADFESMARRWEERNTRYTQDGIENNTEFSPQNVGCQACRLLFEKANF